MGYSQTLSERDPVPSWARYAVMVCERYAPPLSTCIQYFSSRSAAEQWALVISYRFPERTGSDTTMWALVYAYPATGRDYPSSGVCYLAYDPRGVRLKRHALDPSYGHRAARTTAHAPY